jgi:soluble lytic murein transglycosylase-like protein
MAYTAYQLGEMVAQAAARYGINPRLAVEQIRQESSFNPNARSSAGALGIAQFMPDTGRAYGLRYPQDFLDPVKSIDAYARHMRDLLNQLGGRYDLALAGYNWGPSRTAIRQALSSGRSILEYSIPAETRNYVSKIMAAAGGPASSPAPTGSPARLPAARPKGAGIGAEEAAILTVLGILFLKLIRG